MDILIDNDTGRAIPYAHVVERVRHVLDRISVRPTSVRVSFSDVNGPKGGVDVRCALRVALPGQLPICAERVGSTPRLAFDETYTCAVRQIENGRKRCEASHRRPKKYYAAKRLLI